MNPCTLGWYLPLIVKDLPGALQPSDRDRDPPGPGGAGGSSSRDDSARPNGHKVRDGGANGASSYDIDHLAANPAGQSTSAAGQPVQDGDLGIQSLLVRREAMNTKHTIRFLIQPDCL